MNALASFTAAVVTSEPFFANFTISAAGKTDRSCSAISTSSGPGRTKLVPSRIARTAASTTVA